MKARLLLDRRVVVTETAFAELVLWALPRSVSGSPHGYKYRLAFVVRDVCVLRYDNEAGKGDHIHIGRREQPYRFIDPDRLVADCFQTVTLDVNPLADFLAEFARAWKTGKREPSARISFASPDLLWRVLTAKRWDLLKVMAGQGPMSLREAARRVGRDVKGVHGDVHVLLDAGPLRRMDDGRIEFPYEAVHVAFTLRAA